MQFSIVSAALVLVALSETVVAGESHIVHFDNRCGFGTPTLIRGSTVLSTGADFTSNGPLLNAIAYLQTGSCGFNGENCTVIETISLANPISPDSGSSSDINLVPPRAFNVEAGLTYSHGCTGVGADCDNPDCPSAVHNASDSAALQVRCQAEDVDLTITFCEEA